VNVTTSSWLVIALALAAANLPFLTEKLFGVLPLGRTPEGAGDSARTKSGWVRIIELLVLYFVVGAVAYMLEARIGNVFTQVKEFYMITVPLFVVLSFPGFVFRYLRKQR
jgi:hypothetical protein